MLLIVVNRGKREFRIRRVWVSVSLRGGGVGEGGEGRGRFAVGVFSELFDDILQCRMFGYCVSQVAVVMACREGISRAYRG